MTRKKMAFEFDMQFVPAHGTPVDVAPGVQRLTANNPSAFTASSQGQSSRATVRSGQRFSPANGYHGKIVPASETMACNARTVLIHQIRARLCREV